MMKRKKKKPKGPVFKKLDKEAIRALKVNKVPTYDYSWRTNAYVSNLPSLVTDNKAGPALRNSIMDKLSLSKEPVHVQQAIIAKSKTIVPLYNKGPAQPMTQETDATTLGRK